jgi:hypothetical protein
MITCLSRSPSRGLSRGRARPSPARRRRWPPVRPLSEPNSPPSRWRSRATPRPSAGPRTSRRSLTRFGPGNASGPRSGLNSTACVDSARPGRSTGASWSAGCVPWSPTPERLSRRARGVHATGRALRCGLRRTRTNGAASGWRGASTRRWCPRGDLPIGLLARLRSVSRCSPWRHDLDPPHPGGPRHGFESPTRYVG